MLELSFESIIYNYMKQIKITLSHEIDHIYYISIMYKKNT